VAHARVGTGRPLRGGVGKGGHRGALARIGLLHRAGEHHAPHAELGRDDEHVDRTDQVEAQHLGHEVEVAPAGDMAREIEDHVGADLAQGAARLVELAGVAAPPARHARARRALGARDPVHLAAERAQELDERRADEARGARDRHARAGELVEPIVHAGAQLRGSDECVATGVCARRRGARAC
jgi:hypothetical protein